MDKMTKIYLCYRSLLRFIPEKVELGQDYTSSFLPHKVKTQSVTFTVFFPFLCFGFCFALFFFGLFFVCLFVCLFFFFHETILESLFYQMEEAVFFKYYLKSAFFRGKSKKEKTMCKIH